MLNHELTVHGPPSETVDGPMPGTETTVRAHVERTRKLVRDTVGNEVVSDTSAWINPMEIQPGQTVTVAGTKRVVVAVDQLDFPGTASHTRIYL